MFALGLKARFMLLIVVLGVMGIAALAANVVNEWRTVEEINQGIVRSAAETVLDKLDRNLFERYGDVQAFAASDPARSGNAARITAFMNEMMGIYAPVYDVMVFAGMDGKILAANVVDKGGKALNTSALLGMDVSERPWFSRSMSGDIKAGTSHVEDLYLDGDISKIFGSDGAVMAFSAPVTGKDGKIVGVWRNYVSWKDVVISMIDEEVKKLQTPKMPLVLPVLVSNNGTTLLDAANQDGVLSQVFLTPEQLPVVGQVKDRKVDLTSSTFSGEVREAMVASKGYSIYPGIGWRLAVRVPSDDADLRFALYLGLASAFAFCLVVALAYRFTSRTTAHLSRLDDDLLAAADKARRAARAISGAADAVAQSVGEQAAAVQQTAASMEEMNAMVRKSADNAEHSRRASALSEEAMERGRSAVKQVIAAMDEINASNDVLAQQVEESNRKLLEVTKVIGEIGAKTKVINEIVFQTKLLSFNASVEAARAGEHGKGFAVVAEEVGNLAQMSGGAAKEITALLETSTKRVTEIVSDTKTRVETAMQTGRQKVEAGVRLGRDCDSALDEVARSVSEVSSMISEISTATAETATGLAEIGRAINQIDQVTHKNASDSAVAATEAERVSDRVERISRVAKEIATLVVGEGYSADQSVETHAEVVAPQSSPVLSPSPAKVEKKVVSAAATGSNVVALNRGKVPSPRPSSAPIKPAVKSPAAPGGVAVGSDVVPSADDPRFEEV